MKYLNLEIETENRLYEKCPIQIILAQTLAVCKEKESSGTEGFNQIREVHCGEGEKQWAAGSELYDEWGLRISSHRIV
jgi:hypothetical protein